MPFTHFEKFRYRWGLLWKLFLLLRHICHVLWLFRGVPVHWLILHLLLHLLLLLFELISEHAALQSNHFCCFALVSCKHPSLNASTFVVNQALFDVLLEQIFHTSGSEKRETALDVVLSQHTIYLSAFELFLGKHKCAESLGSEIFDLVNYCPLLFIKRLDAALVPHADPFFIASDRSAQDGLISSLRKCDHLSSLNVLNNSCHHFTRRCEIKEL